MTRLIRLSAVALIATLGSGCDTGDSPDGPSDGAPDEQIDAFEVVDLDNPDNLLAEPLLAIAAP